jgi:uncharacterized membrane protein YphA (DoxX/SURF4 family)
MLSLFPELLFVGSVMTPFILRLVVAYAVGTLAMNHLGKQAEGFEKDLTPLFKDTSRTVVKAGAITEIIIAALLAVGLFTQVAALLAVILFGKILFFGKRFPHFGTESRSYHWVLLILSIVVLLSGAGPFAIDIPL